MGLIVVDVEADGPCPGLYSMVSFGAVEVKNLKNTFYGLTAPITNKWIPDSLAVSGFSREEHEGFDQPKDVMIQFARWIDTTKGRPVFISDNLAYDWQWINYYFHALLGHNPFGHSGKRVGDFYAGLVKDVYRSSEWRSFRTTPHTHRPVDDAMGVAEALLYMKNNMGLKF